MKVWQLLCAHIALKFFTIALDQINKLHADVPHIVRRRLHYQDRINLLHATRSRF